MTKCVRFCCMSTSRMFSANSIQPHANQPQAVCLNTDVCVWRSPYGTYLSGCFHTKTTMFCCWDGDDNSEIFLHFLNVCFVHYIAYELSCLLYCLKHKSCNWSAETFIFLQFSMPKNDFILLFVLVTSWSFSCCVLLPNIFWIWDIL